MPRRFAIALVGLLVLLLVALFLVRKVRPHRSAGPARPTPRSTPIVPPTPIPPRRVALYFESAEDERFHPEARDIAASADTVTLLRTIASAVLDGPRRPELLRPFPDGWKVRAAFRLRDGLAVLDLAPPPAPTPPEGEAAQPVRWQTGSHEEEGAAQALLLSVTKNLPDVSRLVLLVGGEPVETLAGHLDLGHPLKPDPSRAADEPPLEPPPPSPTPGPGPTISPTPPEPTLSPTPRPTGREKTPKPTAAKGDEV